jgi:hypothetical protein
MEMKMSRRRPKGRPHMWWIEQVKGDVERRAWDWRRVNEYRNGQIETVGDFRAKVDPQVCKQLMEERKD